MMLLVLGLLVGIVYLISVLIAGRILGIQDDSSESRPPLLPVRRVR